MREPPPATALVTSSGRSQRVVAGAYSAVSGAIDLAAIAAAADQALGAAGGAQKQPGGSDLVVLTPAGAT